ncbi:hypothetical protein [Nocardia sp. alder85J]|uniref:hypothetical protein n=1 Tax=Nocardia sp. alder85J TaxID=2862949 RepID=UPI001CD6AD31|nr:hypothetical protein [Nocardia sp. alder85J]MCX4097717.1 hypothetical protein [Nocardia sp. alder85J]
MDGWVTLAQWADKHGYSPEYVRNFWTPLLGFPAPASSHPRSASSGRFEAEVYSEAALDAFYAAHRPEHRGTTSMLDGPDEFRTLGTIASMLGLDRKTVSQYRQAIDAAVAAEDYQDRGARRLYRTRVVVDWLNARPGRGVAADPATDRRRRRPAETTGEA